jgi:hypothetical protein
MSLVDYSSSDEDEMKEVEEKIVEIKNKKSDAENDIPTPIPQIRKAVQSSNTQRNYHHNSSNKSEASILKLPDASLLLNMPVSVSKNIYDHSSRVAAAMAENASRKRETSGPSAIRSKVPKGNLPHSKNIPEVSGGLLRPPQLSGRYYKCPESK